MKLGFCFSTNPCDKVSHIYTIKQTSNEKNFNSVIIPSSSWKRAGCRRDYWFRSNESISRIIFSSNTIILVWLVLRNDRIRNMWRGTLHNCGSCARWNDKQRSAFYFTSFYFSIKYNPKTVIKNNHIVFDFELEI